MALMTWSGKYSVGVEALDHQHESMMDILNKLHAASMKGNAGEVADSLLRKLAPLAEEHFAAEERLMESIDFPRLAEHRALHREMAGRIAELASRHEEGDITAYVPLLYFVRDYQTKHMRDEDLQYAEWYRSHRANDRPHEPEALPSRFH
jgi:hemerythrin